MTNLSSCNSWKLTIDTANICRLHNRLHLSLRVAKVTQLSGNEIKQVSLLCLEVNRSYLIWRSRKVTEPLKLECSAPQCITCKHCRLVTEVSIEHTVREPRREGKELDLTVARAESRAVHEAKVGRITIWEDSIGPIILLVHDGIQRLPSKWDVIIPVVCCCAVMLNQFHVHVAHHLVPSAQVCVHVERIGKLWPFTNATDSESHC